MASKKYYPTSQRLATVYLSMFHSFVSLKIIFNDFIQNMLRLLHPLTENLFYLKFSYTEVVL